MSKEKEPTIRQLRALEALARTKSFTAAAAEIGVSQPTISNLIVALERQTESRFLRRSGNKIETTELFEDIRPQLRAILELKSEIDQRIFDRTNLKDGNFWVGYTSYQIAMPYIARFIQRYPGVNLTARANATYDLLPLLENGDLDVAFVTGQAPFKEYHTQKIASFRIGVIVPREGAFKDVSVLTWRDLEGLALIQREPNAATRRSFEAAAAKAGATTNTLIGLGSWGSITSLVREGIGVGIAFESELSKADSDLKFVAVDDPNLRAHQFLVTMPAMAQTSMVRQFFEMVLETPTSDAQRQKNS